MIAWIMEVAYCPKMLLGIWFKNSKGWISQINQIGRKKGKYLGSYSLRIFALNLFWNKT